MNRSKRLLKKRRKQIGLLMEIKKSRPDYSWKRSIIEISEALCISNSTVREELRKYNKSVLTTQKVSDLIEI